MSDEKGRGEDAAPISIFLVGDSGVGKTSLAVRFARDEFNQDAGPASAGGTQPFSKDVWIKGEGKKLMRVTTQVWDIFAGDEEPPLMAGTSIEAADGILLLYDLSNYLSFSNVSSWLTAIEKNAREDCLIMLVGNKDDVTDDDRAVSTAAGSSLAKERGMAYVETSALTGKSVEAAFRLMAQECHDVRRITSGKEIKPKKKRKKKKANHADKANKKEKASKKAEKRVRVKIPETDRSNPGNGCGSFGGSTLSRRTASSLLAARVQARHEKYKRRGKKVDKIGADLEAITERSNESSSVGPSPDVLAAARRACKAGDEEDGEEGGGGRPGDAAAEIEEGLGRRVRAELVPNEDQRNVLSGASDHGDFGNVPPLTDGVRARSHEELVPDEDRGSIPSGAFDHDDSGDVPPLADGVCAPSHGETKGCIQALPTNEAPCSSEGRTPTGKGGTPIEAKEGGRVDTILRPELIGIIHDARGSPSEIAEAAGSSTLSNFADALDDDASEVSDANRMLRVRAQSTSFAQPAAIPSASTPDSMNATIGEPIQSTRDEELGTASPAIAGATAVEGERESKMPANDAASGSSASRPDLKNGTIDEAVRSARDEESGAASPAIAGATPAEGERESKMPANDAASSSSASTRDLKNAAIDEPIQSTRDEEVGAAPAIAGVTPVEGERESKMPANDAASSPSASTPDLKNATIDEPTQPTRDEEFAASPAIAGATPVEGERESKMPANDAAYRANEETEAKSMGPLRWRHHRRLLLAFPVAILILVAGAVAVWVVFAPRMTDTAPSSIDVVVLPPSASPSVSIISETTKPTVGRIAEPLTGPSELASKAPSRASLLPTARPSTNWPTSGPSELMSKTPTNVSLRPTARPSTNWPTSGPSELTSKTPTKRPTTKRPTVKPVTPSPTRGPSKVIFDRSNPTRSPVKDFDAILCTIDRGWRVQVGDDLRGCYWVGRLPGKRCDSSTSTKGVPAAVGCPEQCNPDCRPDGS